jgi:hypothetical protein
MKSTVFLSVSQRDGEATKRPGYSHAIPTFRESCKFIETKIISRHTLQGNSEHVRSNPQENKQTNKQANKGATSPRYGQVEELHQGVDGWRSFTTALQIWSLRLERCVFFHF